jgi:hypothetical protein
MKNGPKQIFLQRIIMFVVYFGMSHLLDASCHDAAFSNQTYDATPDIFSSRLKTPVYREMNCL